MRPTDIGRVRADSGASSRLRRARESPKKAPGETMTVRAAIETFALVIPPVTLLTALAYWFGWTLTNTRAAYFGIDQSTLGYTAQDYLLRSADAAFVPVVTLLLTTLCLIGLHRVTGGLIRHGVGIRVLRRAALAALVLGLIALAGGIYLMFDPQRWLHYLVPPLILGGGLLAAAYAARVLQRTGAREPPPASVWERATTILVLLVVLLTAFWAASLYAAALGRGRAQQLAAAIRDRPRVTIFSAKALVISGPGVTETPITASDSAYRYRYTGLRLLIRSGARYFLVPAGWTRRHGTVVVLDEATDIRFEFAPGGD